MLGCHDFIYIPHCFPGPNWSEHAQMRASQTCQWWITASEKLKMTQVSFVGH